MTDTPKKLVLEPAAATPNLFSPEALTPTIAVPEQAKLFWFWIGVRLDCPRSALRFGGLCFSKQTFSVLRDLRQANGATSRIAHPGQLVKLSLDQLTALAETIPRRILRIVPRPGKAPICGLLRIPLPEDEQQMLDEGLHFRPYVPSDRDHPLSRFIYCQYVPGRNPVKPMGSTPIPLSVAEIGIGLPPADAVAATVSDLVKPQTNPEMDGGLVHEHGHPRPIDPNSIEAR